MRMPVSEEAVEACQQIVQGEGFDLNVRDAAVEAIEGHRTGRGIDIAVARVLAQYATRQGQQNRWGQ